MNLSEQLNELHKNEKPIDESMTETNELIESLISEAEKELFAGLTSEGEPEYMLKKKLDSKSTSNKFSKEAVKWAKKHAGGSELAQTLFQRMTFLVDNEKLAKKAFKELGDAQKSKLPYHPSKTSAFFFPNFNFKGDSVLGDPKFLTDIKGDRGFMYDPMVFMDRKYKVVINNLSKAKEVHTASDLIGHDVTLSKLGKGTKVRIYIQKGKVSGVPSNLRLVNAFNKLKSSGYTDAELVNSDRLTDKEKEKLEG